ncbi:hypothetical protein BLNAU_11205 [Blattamonas nauphoetae]|uniref:Uncharacterized protein n=1 Tax=Blattamonas nauphoetae TaxID=2049346 RepID=A0ABQ9XSA6_9EUKA|nr:hypothetical protein BLNAU_11205 [Blattamonas nauphoetae]
MHTSDSEVPIGMESSAFLQFVPNVELSFEDKSAIYCSLVSLIRGNCELDDALQDKAATFLQSLHQPRLKEPDANRIISELVPSTNRSSSGFICTICILLSSSHPKIVVASLWLLHESLMLSSPDHKIDLVQTDFISQLFTILHPLTLPISGNEIIFNLLNWILISSIRLAESTTVRALGIIEPAAQNSHRELVLQRAIQPSSQYLSFLHQQFSLIATGDLGAGFGTLLGRLLHIGPFHHPTLEFVLNSPIVITSQDFLTFAEESYSSHDLLFEIHKSTNELKTQGPEAAQSGKQMMQALISEGFEDSLEMCGNTQIAGNEYEKVVKKKPQEAERNLNANM